MVSSKVSRGRSSKVSSSIASAATSTTQTVQKSSVLQSRFAPSDFQLSLFASTIQSFEGQRLRIHNTITGRLHCEHSINSKATINCLDWGRYGEVHNERRQQESRKKRKRSEDANGFLLDPRDVVVAFGTSESEIHLFSPSESKIVHVLRGEHTQGVRDFRFAGSGSELKGWSVGGDGKIVQWDLRTGKSTMSLRAPAASVTTICPVEQYMLCASHTAYLLDLEEKKELHSFTASSNPVHTIIVSGQSSTSLSAFLTASKTERAINVFDVPGRKLAGTLVSAAETICLAFSSGQETNVYHKRGETAANGISLSAQSLAAVNKDGTIELFPSPFELARVSKPPGSESSKARRKGTAKKAAAVIKITRAENSSGAVPVLNVAFEDNDIVMAWTEGGVNVLFERIRWREEGTGRILLAGVHEIVKTNVGAAVRAAITNGIKDTAQSRVDDSHTVVANGIDMQMGMDPSSAIDVSSADDESEYSEEADNGDEVLWPEPLSLPASQNDGKQQANPVSQLTGQDNEDVEMQEPEEQDAVTGKEEIELEEDLADTEPSFGEMVRANAQQAIDVQASFPPQTSQVVATAGERSHQLPSGMSLGTVLSQSLLTNDVSLLESCFHSEDLRTVRATIERIDSSLATVLLQRLAERLYSRPGRAGSLMVWIQWTLVAHGGYLASQPEVMKKLTSLHRVVAERANSLQSLLSLKGKLDMLEAQMNLRKSMQARASAANAVDDNDEEGLIYVEGQEESDSEDEADNAVQSSQTDRKEIQRSFEDESDSESDGVDDAEGEEGEMPTTMYRVISESEDEDSESGNEGIIDDEAVPTDQDSDDNISADEVDHEDISSVGSEASSEAEDVPPAKRLAKAKLANGLHKKS